MEDIEIEYLDEYKDLVLPGIKTSSEGGRGSSTAAASSDQAIGHRLPQRRRTSSDSSGSSSIDLDIFQKLFDGKFLDDELLAESGSNTKVRSRRRLSSSSTDSNDGLEALYKPQGSNIKNKRGERLESYDSIDDLGDALMGTTANSLTKAISSQTAKKSQSDGLHRGSVVAKSKSADSRMHANKSNLNAASKPNSTTDSFKPAGTNGSSSSSSSSNARLLANKKKAITIIKAQKPDLKPPKHEPKQDPLHLQDFCNDTDSDSSYEYESDFYGYGDSEEDDGEGSKQIIDISTDSSAASSLADTVTPVVSDDESVQQQHTPHAKNERLQLYLNNLSSAETPPSKHKYTNYSNDKLSRSNDKSPTSWNQTDHEQVTDTVNQALPEAEEPLDCPSSSTGRPSAADYVDDNLTYETLERLSRNLAEQIISIDVERSLERGSSSKRRSTSSSKLLSSAPSSSLCKSHVRKLTYSNEKLDQIAPLRRAKSDDAFPKRVRGRPQKSRAATTEEQSKWGPLTPLKTSAATTEQEPSKDTQMKPETSKKPEKKKRKPGRPKRRGVPKWLKKKKKANVSIPKNLIEQDCSLLSSENHNKSGNVVETQNSKVTNKKRTRKIVKSKISQQKTDSQSAATEEAAMSELGGLLYNQNESLSENIQEEGTKTSLIVETKLEETELNSITASIIQQDSLPQSSITATETGVLNSNEISVEKDSADQCNMETNVDEITAEEAVKPESCLQTSGETDKAEIIVSQQTKQNPKIKKKPKAKRGKVKKKNKTVMKAKDETCFEAALENQLQDIFMEDNNLPEEIVTDQNIVKGERTEQLVGNLQTPHEKVKENQDDDNQLNEEATPKEKMDAPHKTRQNLRSASGIASPYPESLSGRKSRSANRLNRCGPMLSDNSPVGSDSSAHTKLAPIDKQGRSSSDHLSTTTPLKSKSEHTPVGKARKTKLDKLKEGSSNCRPLRSSKPSTSETPAKEKVKKPEKPAKTPRKPKTPKVDDKNNKDSTAEAEINADTLELIDVETIETDSSLVTEDISEKQMPTATETGKKELQASIPETLPVKEPSKEQGSADVPTTLAIEATTDDDEIVRAKPRCGLSREIRELLLEAKEIEELGETQSGGRCTRSRAGTPASHTRSKEKESTEISATEKTKNADGTEAAPGTVQGVEKESSKQIKSKNIQHVDEAATPVESVDHLENVKNSCDSQERNEALHSKKTKRSKVKKKKACDPKHCNQAAGTDTINLVYSQLTQPSCSSTSVPSTPSTCSSKGSCRKLRVLLKKAAESNIGQSLDNVEKSEDSDDEQVDVVSIEPLTEEVPIVKQDSIDKPIHLMDSSLMEVQMVEKDKESQKLDPSEPDDPPKGQDSGDSKQTTEDQQIDKAADMPATTIELSVSKQHQAEKIEAHDIAKNSPLLNEKETKEQQQPEEKVSHKEKGTEDNPEQELAEQEEQQPKVLAEKDQQLNMTDSKEERQPEATADKDQQLNMTDSKKEQQSEPEDDKDQQLQQEIKSAETKEQQQQEDATAVEEQQQIEATDQRQLKTETQKEQQTKQIASENNSQINELDTKEQQQQEDEAAKKDIETETMEEQQPEKEATEMDQELNATDSKEQQEPEKEAASKSQKQNETDTVEQQPTGNTTDSKEQVAADKDQQQNETEVNKTLMQAADNNQQQTEEQLVAVNNDATKTTGVTASVDVEGGIDSISSNADAPQLDEKLKQQAKQAQASKSSSSMAPPAPPKRELPTGKAVMRRMGKSMQDTVQPTQKRRKIGDTHEQNEIKGNDNTKHQSLTSKKTNEPGSTLKAVDEPAAKTTFKKQLPASPAAGKLNKSLTPESTKCFKLIRKSEVPFVKTSSLSSLLADDEPTPVDNVLIITKTALANQTVEPYQKVQTSPTAASGINISVSVVPEANLPKDQTPQKKTLSQAETVKKLLSMKAIIQEKDKASEKANPVAATAVAVNKVVVKKSLPPAAASPVAATPVVVKKSLPAAAHTPVAASPVAASPVAASPVATPVVKKSLKAAAATPVAESPVVVKKSLPAAAETTKKSKADKREAHALSKADKQSSMPAKVNTPKTVGRPPASTSEAAKKVTNKETDVKSNTKQVATTSSNGSKKLLPPQTHVTNMDPEEKSKTSREINEPGVSPAATAQPNKKKESRKGANKSLSNAKSKESLPSAAPEAVAAVKQPIPQATSSTPDSHDHTKRSSRMTKPSLTTPSVKRARSNSGSLGDTPTLPQRNLDNEQQQQSTLSEIVTQMKPKPQRKPRKSLKVRESAVAKEQSLDPAAAADPTPEHAKRPSSRKRKLPSKFDEQPASAKRLKEPAAKPDTSIAFPVRITAASASPNVQPPATAAALPQREPTAKKLHKPKAQLQLPPQPLPTKLRKLRVRLNRNYVKNLLKAQQQKVQQQLQQEAPPAATNVEATAVAATASAEPVLNVPQSKSLRQFRRLPVPKTVPLPALEVKTEKADEIGQQPMAQLVEQMEVDVPVSSISQVATSNIPAMAPETTATIENMPNNTDTNIITPTPAATTSTAVIPSASSASDVHTFGTTKMFSFLYPSRYQRSYGHVGLDFCCPNLDGPMQAIDPTRLHSKVEVPVQELPQYIVISTKIISKLDKNIPQKVRAQLEQLEAKDGLPCVMQSVQTTTMTTPLMATTTTTASELTTPNTIDRLSKQLPRGTTLTKKVHLSGAAPVAPTPTVGVSSSPTMTSLIPKLLQLPPICPADKQRMELQTRVQRFDLVLQNLSRRVITMSVLERQQVIENIVKTSTLLPIDVDVGTKLLENYVYYINAAPTAQQRSILTPALAASTPTHPSTPISTCPSTTPLLTKSLNATNATTPVSMPPSAVASVRQSSGAASTSTPIPPVDVRRPIYDKEKNVVIGYQYKTPRLARALAAASASASASSSASSMSLLPAGTAMGTGTGTPVATVAAQQQPRILMMPGPRLDYGATPNHAGNTSGETPPAAAVASRATQRVVSGKKAPLNQSPTKNTYARSTKALPHGRQPKAATLSADKVTPIGVVSGIPVLGSSASALPAAITTSSTDRASNRNLFIVNQLLSQPEECILPDAIGTIDPAAPEIKGEVDDTEIIN